LLVNLALAVLKLGTMFESAWRLANVVVPAGAITDVEPDNKVGSWLAAVTLGWMLS
jgi:hypothetical protein